VRIEGEAALYEPVWPDEPDCLPLPVELAPDELPVECVPEFPIPSGGPDTGGDPGAFPAGVEAGGPAGVLGGGVDDGGAPGVFPAGVPAGGPGVLPTGLVAEFPLLPVDDVLAEPVLEVAPGLGIEAQNAWTVSPFACASALKRENAVDDRAFPRVVVFDALESGAT
jgi:hypothetical protein